MRALALTAVPVLLLAVAACGGGKGTATASSSSSTSGSGGAGTSSASSTSATGGSGGSMPAGEPFVYVGGYGNLIHVFHLDRTTGALDPAGMVDAGENPSFLAFAPDKHTLFAVNEASGTSAAVASFHIDGATGGLTFVSRVSSQGDGPAHLSTDASGAFAMVANYGGGTVAVLPVAADGTLSAAVDVHDHGGNANPHQIFTTPDNRFAYVPNKGLDTVSAYGFNAATGKLSTASTLMVASGAGPRHMALHPTAPNAYLIDENDSTLSALSVDKTTGKLAVVQTVSTLPSGFSGSNTGAEVQVAPSGKFVYGSNRGHDSIVICRVESGGTLTVLGHQSTMGMTPRHFSLDPSGEILLVANQGSDSVVTFHVDTSTGMLTQAGAPVSVQQPSFVGVLVLPGT